MRKVCYIFLTACLANNAFGLAKYTYEMTEAHMRGLIQNPNTSPYISPTISGDASKALDDSSDLADYVVGTTRANDPTNPAFPNSSKFSACPAFNLYGYKISDPYTTGPKINIVIIAGIHGSESSGTWTSQGMIDFCAGNEPQAINLRKMANIFVYPLCNPAGRYLTVSGLSVRGSPELQRMIDDGLIPDGMTDNDMNRVWHLKSLGVSFSNTDALIPAMIADTGGQADYFFDYHGGNQDGASFIYTVQSLYKSPFIIEFDKLNPYVPGEDSMVHVTSYLRPGDYRMTRVWSMRPYPVGLNARFGCTPENTGIGTSQDRFNLGRLYGLAVHNAIVAEMVDAEIFQLQELAENWLCDERINN